MRKTVSGILLLLAFVQVLSAQLNNPHPPAESKEKILYTSFNERPKFLDPARSYSADEYEILCQIYEPVVQYHYLKRPYELVPLSADGMPSYAYFDKDGKKLPNDAPADQVARTIWTIKIQKGIMFQEHPCFARNKDGSFMFHNLTEDDMDDIQTLFDFKHTGTRELKASDYVYQIKRLADFRNRCPIFPPVVAEYIFGMTSFYKKIQQMVDDERARRKAEAGIFYNREEDEKKKPIIIDYNSIPCEGLNIVDDYTYEIVLNKKYPQFIFWLAMPFFSPMPEEAIRFYGQEQNIDRSIILHWYPVGTGAYRLQQYDPKMRIVLVKNEHYRNEPYPSEGEPDDEKNGLLADAGKPLPLIPKIVFCREKESSPIWRKFNQGYYDSAGINSENFAQVMDLTVTDAKLSPQMAEKGIKLVTSVATSLYYTGFNMEHPVVGGLEESKCKLRQALCIALDREEYIKIFANGRGLVAQGPIPPGIFGYRDGKEGVNTYTHKWDPETGEPRRRSIEYAKKLLAEAGYPDGIGEDGKPLVVRFDTIQRGGNAIYLDWLKKQFQKINVTLEISETDYNRFREKMSTGNYQIFGWGWNADYPDPENFLFLLYGPNGKVKYHGENAANYSNPEYDKLFEKMKTMENSPERQKIIDQMIEILRHDAPWEFGWTPKGYGLYHSWYKNAKPNLMANNTYKYKNIDLDARNRYREEHNKPKLGYVFLMLFIIGAVIIPGIIMAIKGEMN